MIGAKLRTGNVEAPHRRGLKPLEPRMSITTAAPREFLTRKEAAQYITERYFRVTARTLAVYATNLEGPPYRILGGMARYSPAEIDAWVRKSEHYGNVEPNSAPGALSGQRR